MEEIIKNYSDIIKIKDDEALLIFGEEIKIILNKI